MTSVRLESAALRSLVKFSTTEPLRSHFWHLINVVKMAIVVGILTFEQQHEISNNVVCATSKASDQPAQTHSLIRAFASRLNIL